jgi:UDP-N-acetylmuramoyl-L-alanyl-D-glutamate--2,6-diaminopimelate ligase
MEHYAACKKTLLTDYGAPIIVANTDDASAQNMLSSASGKVVSCSTERCADFYAEQICDTMRGAIPVSECICRDSAGGAYKLSLPLIGKHNVSNALIVLAIARALGISPDRAAAALSDVTIPGRFELIEHRGALIVIDYAHNGASLRAALGALRPRTRGRLLCLVGSVGERTQCRREELGRAADELADFTYLTADDPGCERVEDICRDMIAAFKPRFLPNYTVIVDRAEAIRAAMNELREGDVLLLAGKGDERTQRIGGESIPLRDRDVVESYIRADKHVLS